METETSEALKKLDEKLDAVYVSVAKIQKYMLWSFIMQLAMILLPLAVLMFAVPFILSSLSNLSGLYQGL